VEINSLACVAPVIRIAGFGPLPTLTAAYGFAGYSVYFYVDVCSSLKKADENAASTN